MSLGFEAAGFDVLAAIDSDPVHLAVHERNLPHAHALCSDVLEVSKSDVHASVRKGWALAGRDGEWDGTIHCLIGGPSCQGFSDIGRQATDDRRNDLIFEFARLVEEVQPRTFVMENVPGLLFPKVRHKLDKLQRQFRDAGYTLQAGMPTLLDASEHGVPQKRRRVFIVGVADGLETPALPPVQSGPTVSEALGDLPDVDSFESLLTSDELVLDADQLAALTAAASPYAMSLRGRQGFAYLRKWDRSVLSGSQRTQHSKKVQQRFAALAPGDQDLQTRTSRLDGTDYAKTLRAGTGRDHGSFTAPRPIHHVHARVVTVREAARLHSFPDWFSFHVTKWHALREIGNSVPPRLAQAVAATVVSSLGMAPSSPRREVKLGDRSLLEMSLREAAEYYGYDLDKLPPDVRRR